MEEAERERATWRSHFPEHTNSFKFAVEEILIVLVCLIIYSLYLPTLITKTVARLLHPSFIFWLLIK